MNFVTENSFKKFNVSDSTERLMWKTTERSVLLKTPIFDVKRARRSSSDGRESDFVQVCCPNWITVVPYFTGSDGKLYFVMELQYRHGLENISLEFPSGIIEKNEEPAHAVLRELEEETGIKAHKIEKLAALNPNPAFMTNTGNFFIAGELEDTKITHFDKNEQIETVTVPAEYVFENVGTGMMANEVVLVACTLFKKYMNH